MKTWLITHKKRLLTLGIVAVMAVVFRLGWRAGIGATDRKAYAALWEAMKSGGVSFCGNILRKRGCLEYNKLDMLSLLSKDKDGSNG